MHKIILALLISLIVSTGYAQNIGRVTNQGMHPYKHRPSDVSITGSAAADNDCLKYDLATGLFEWGTCGSGGSSQWITTSVGIGTYGNVGIGTITPSARLDVESSTSTDGIDINITSTGTGCDSSAVFLTHADGVDASTTFTEEGCSSAAKTLTAVGNAQIDTAQSKFGGASYLGDGTGDYVSAADSEDFNFGTGDWTVDFWFRTTSDPQTTTQEMVGQSTAGSYNDVFDLYLQNGLLRIYNFVGAAAVGNYITAAVTPTVANTWYHLEFCRSGTGAYIFVDGVSQALTTLTAYGTNNSGNFTGTWRMGDVISGGVVGHMDEVRVTKGSCRHTSNFTPETSAYGVSSNSPQIDFQSNGTSKALLYVDGADSNKFKIKDDVDVNMTIQTDGNIGIGTLSPATSPTAAVHIVNSKAVNSFRVDDVNGGDDSPFIIDSVGNISIGTSIATALLDITSTAGQNLFMVNDNGVADASPFVINQFGNVGIGTLNPDYFFVVGNTAGTGRRMVLNAATPLFGSALQGDSGGWALGWKFLGSSNTILGGYGALASADTLSYYWIGADFDRSTFMAAADGNVGIGTFAETSPNASLEVTKYASRIPFSVSSASTESGDYFVINSAGNVGIGTTLGTDNKLTVLGGNVGIGTWVTAAALNLIGTSRLQGTVTMWPTGGASNAQAFLDSFTNSQTVGSLLTFRKSSSTTHGTIATTVDNDVLGQFSASGTDTTPLQLSAGRVAFEQDGSAGSFSMPGRIIFGTTPSGSLTPVDRLTIKNTGNIGIGTITPNALLNINSSAAQILFRVDDTAGVDVSPAIVVDSTGNVGIGTFVNNPTFPTKAFVSGPITVDTSLLFQTANTVNYEAIKNLDTPPSPHVNTSAIFVLIADSADSGYPNGTSIAPSAGLSAAGIYSSTNVGIGTFDVSAGRLTITGGNVGIGTTVLDSLVATPGVVKIGIPASVSAPLRVLGGSGGTDLITLERSSGATLTYGWSLAGGGLTFTDRTAGQATIGLYGDSSANEMYYGVRLAGTTHTRPALLSAGNFNSAFVGANVPGNTMQIQGGLGVGTANSGNIIFTTGNVGVGTLTNQDALTRMTIIGSTGNIGIGTTVANYGIFNIDAGTVTGQVRMDGDTGGCLMIRDTDNAGWTECDALDGALTCSIDLDGICE